MKKIGKAVTALLAGCMLFTGCQSFENLIPEQYGAWENNYIYRGNARSKTTGEDFEYLVTEVELDGRSYSVDSCLDYGILGDDIYMCLSLSFAWQEMLYSSAIVKYNVQSKTQETVYVYQPIPENLEGAGTAVSYDTYAIEGLNDQGLLLRGRKESADYNEEGTRENYASVSAYYYMDLEGNITGELPYEYYLSYAKGNDTYWWNTAWEDNEWSLYYVTREEQEPVFVCKKSTLDYAYEVTFIEKNGAVGFLIESFEKEKNEFDERRFVKMEFYNLKTNAFTTLYEGTKYARWVSIPKNEYFVVYDYQTITYHYRDGLLSPRKKEQAQMKTNCVLYEIEYSEQGAECKVLQEFGERKNITDIRAVADGKALLNAIWYEDARGCSFGGMEQEYCEINFTTGEQTDMDSKNFGVVEDEYFAFYARQTGKTCGEYVYYLQKEKLNVFMADTSYAYLLKRYNTDTQKTEVMQLWHEKYAREGEKACEEMWRGMNGDIEEFIVRGY